MGAVVTNKPVNNDVRNRSHPREDLKKRFENIKRLRKVKHDLPIIPVPASVKEKKALAHRKRVHNSSSENSQEFVKKGGAMAKMDSFVDSLVSIWTIWDRW